MKASFATAALILAAAACLGWRDHQELVATRTKNTELLAEAAELGITPDPKHPHEKVLFTHQRESRPKLTSAEYIAFVKEMMAEEKRQRGKGPNQEFMNRYESLMERLSTLDESELKRLLAELRSSPELDDESRNGAFMMAAMTLATYHPQTALTLLIESEDSLPKAFMRKHLALNAFTSWAKSDPVAGVKWVKEHGEKCSDLVDDSLKRRLLSGAAAQDPKLAFQLIGDLKFKDADNAFGAIIEATKTPEERTATLNALHDYASTLEDSKMRTHSIDKSLSLFADAVTEGGFQNAVQWFDSAKLSPTELQSFSRGISYDFISPGEAGQWVEWMGKTLPAKEASTRISSLISDWTESDYQAAGTWLTQAPDGPVKQAAVSGYVETIAPYEPETAVQWAMTLPPGKERDGSLQKIYQKWPKKDPASKAAAEAFADQHGIKR